MKQNLFDSVLNDGNQTDFVDFSEKGRSQFLQQMQEMAEEFGSQAPAEEAYEAEALREEDLVHAPEPEPEETTEDNIVSESETVADEPQETEEVAMADVESMPAQTGKKAVNAQKMEVVMNNGMQFLSGLFQMATGKEMGIEEQKIEINRETGEVTMKFKLPLDS